MSPYARSSELEVEGRGDERRVVIIGAARQILVVCKVSVGEAPTDGVGQLVGQAERESVLGGIGAEKCGGGWYDPSGTTEKTYVEQARQTILGGARESRGPELSQLDIEPFTEHAQTVFGEVRRVGAARGIEGITPASELQAGPLGTDPPAWS